MGAVQQMVSVETPHSNGTRLGLVHSSSATQDQPLSFGSGHGEFGHPRQLILSEEHNNSRNSDKGLAPAMYTPYHGHAYDGSTPAQFSFPPGADATTMLPQAAAVAAPQLLQLQPPIRQPLGPPATARATAPAAVICAASATADTPAHVGAFGATTEPTDTSVMFSVF